MKFLPIIFIVNILVVVGVIGFTIWNFFNSGNPLGLAILGVIFIAFMIFFWPFLRNLMPVKNGIEAEAKTLKVWDTGATINDNPRVGLLLEVAPLGGSPFQVEAQATVSRLKAALVRPGIAAKVRYDPKNPKRVQVLSLDVQGAAPASSSSSRLEELETLRAKNLVSEAEYRRKREEILRNL